MNETEDKLSDMEDRIAASNYKRKGLLKITDEWETIQQLQDDEKKNIRIIVSMKEQKPTLIT